MALRGAVLHGAGRVFAVGSREKTVEVAKKYGATDIIDYHNGRISDQILEATGGQGVDKVLIAGGNAKDTFEEAVRMLKPGGSTPLRTVLRTVSSYTAITNAFSVPRLP
ncbi:zinc-binding dehydrogenase [Limosilactobacillus fermentum]|nr:zinc-binding dehydrogenase [Limosilactobacillus fermentum]